MNFVSQAAHRLIKRASEWLASSLMFQRLAVPNSLDEDVISEPGTVLFREAPTPERRLWEKIKFDNKIRIWIASLSFVVSFLLWSFHALPFILGVAFVFLVYVGIQAGLTWLFVKVRPTKWVDFGLCGVDLIAMSGGVYFTGGIASPLYFIYFIPLIAQAFHHDWDQILFNGFGGIFCYAFAVSATIHSWDGPQVLDLSARIFFMLVTVSVSALAVNILREKEKSDRTTFDRMQLLARLSHRLNTVNALRDLPPVVTKLVADLNADWGKAKGVWARLLLTGEDRDIMRAHVDPHDARLDLKQEIETHACPAFAGDRVFAVNDSGVDPACPVEKFNFGSHLCIAVTGAGNESFGVLFVGSEAAGAFSDEDKEFLRFVARSIALTIQRLEHVEDLNRSLELSSCATAIFISSYKSLDATFEAILNGARSMFGSDQASIMLWDSGKSVLTTRDARGPRARSEWELSFHLGEGIQGRVFESGEPISTSDIAKDPLYRRLDLAAHNLLCLPLTTLHGETLGVLTLLRFESYEPYSGEIIETALTLATRASMAIENALLHESRRAALAQRLADQKRAA